MHFYTSRILIISVAMFLLYMLYCSVDSPPANTGIPLYVSRVFEEDHKGFFGLANFSYVLTPHNICSGNASIKIILIVTSFAGEVVDRSALRRAYSQDELLQLGIWRVFLLALTKPKRKVDSPQKSIENESHRFGDILQGNFYESYYNLTYKHLMGLEWASRNATKLCPRVKFIFKMDDDIVVDLYKMVQVAEAYDKNSTWDILGHVFEKSRPIRRKSNKWYVTKEEYDRDYYPTFVSGWFYIAKPSTAALISQNVWAHKFFWIDDVFLTGVVAESFNASITSISQLFSTFPELMYCCINHSLNCEFAVSPSGGNSDLQVRFQEHSKKCSKMDACPTLPPPKNISQICVAQKVLPQLRKGYASVEEIHLSRSQRDALCSHTFFKCSGWC